MCGPIRIHNFWISKASYIISQGSENISVIFHSIGECVVFDNLRVLHGRKGFGLKEDGERTIQGGYVDWDEVRSKINILKLVLGKD